MKKKKQQAVFKNTEKTQFDLSNIRIPNFSFPAIKFKKVPLLILFALISVTVLFAFSSKPDQIKSIQKQLMVALPKQPISNLVATTNLKDINWKNVIVKKGQSLSSIFKDLKLSQNLLYKIIHHNKETKQLTKIYPGAIIAFDINENGHFSQLKYKISESKELFVKLNDDSNDLSTNIVVRPTELNIQTTNGIITGSFFNAGKKSGLSDAMIMKLASVFAWDIDFVLDIRQGDSFSVIYEKVFQDGEFLRDGEIIAASFTNQGESYKAVSYDDGNGLSYYNPEGRNMKKAFLRAPLNFSYISSNFNPKRFHPVQKRIKPHRGIDYAAPRGTPVFAAGDGVVTRSSYDKYNGNHVFIKHPSGIVTKYLHFTKKKVKKGQRVKQGQTIGTVGSTGMVTGAHLHYEFVLNGVHRNPRTVKLPKASPLAKDKIKDYLLYASPVLSQLKSISVNKIAITQHLDNQKES